MLLHKSNSIEKESANRVTEQERKRGKVTTPTRCTRAPRSIEHLAYNDSAHNAAWQRNKKQEFQKNTTNTDTAAYATTQHPAKK